MSSRARAAAALASLGILGLGWGTATAQGQVALALNPPTTDTTTPSDTASSDTTASDTASSDTASSGTAATSGSGASSSSGGTTSSSSTGSWADGTYTGSTARHRYGSVTVTVIVANGTITGVSESVVSDGDRKSNQINARAVPAMRSAVLKAQGDDVATISGATYTTEAYLTSLQSALDQAAA